MLYSHFDRDPAVDREEFEFRIRSCSCCTNFFTLEEIVMAQLDNDTAKIAEIKACRAACEAWVQKDLDAWDAAPDEAGRRVLVGSVKAYVKP